MAGSTNSRFSTFETASTNRSWRIPNSSLDAWTYNWIDPLLDSEYYDDDADNDGQCLPAEWFRDSIDGDGDDFRQESDAWTKISQDLRELVSMDKSKLMKFLRKRFPSMSDDLVREINRKWMKVLPKQKNPKRFERLLNSCMPTMGVLNPWILHFAKYFKSHSSSEHRSGILKKMNCVMEDRFRMEAIQVAVMRRNMSKKLFRRLEIDLPDLNDVADALFCHQTASQQKRLKLASRLLEAVYTNAVNRLNVFNVCSLYMSEANLKSYINPQNESSDDFTKIWKPLRHPDSIRYFKLYSDETGGLCFQLFETRLSDPVKYKALSYVWGERGDVAVIKSPHGERKLQKNLYEFLRSLVDRHISRETNFWVDALCINQDSIEEKNQQVQQIEKTFKQAEEVIAWVGSHSMNTLRTLTNLHPIVESSMFDQILSHVYWQRVWIVQEVITAGNLTFLNEVHGLAYRHLYNLRTKSLSTPKVDVSDRQSYRASFGLGRLEQIDDLIGETPWLMDSLLNARNRSIRRKGDSDQALIDVISRYKDQKCTNLRDRVYALVSLSTLRDELKIDYNITLGQLFWRVLCTSSRSLSLSTAYDVMQALNLSVGDLVPSSTKVFAVRNTHRNTEDRTQITTEEWEEVQNATIFGGHASVMMKPVISFNGSNGDLTARSQTTGLLSTSYKLLGGTIEKGDCLLNIPAAGVQIVLRQSVKRESSRSYVFHGSGLATEWRKYDELMEESSPGQRLKLNQFFSLRYGKCTGDKVWIDVPTLWLLLILNNPNGFE